MKTGIRVLDAMTKNPIVCPPSTSILDAAKLMGKKDVGSLIISDERKTLLGIVTEKDFVQKVIAKRIKDSEPITKIMTDNVFTTNPEVDIYDAIKKMRDLEIRHLPVLNHDKTLIGMITLKDILKIQPSLFELIVDMIEIRESDDKMSLLPEREGYCELCGKISSDLIRTNNGKYICESCFEAGIKDSDFK
ncbi:MAG TPA: CBS domain-containing protein [Candidatus Woesearchaeota archaeon]|nr:CBS domain-containing protein [Candidatus Woesearchaeota archaeon]